MTEYTLREHLRWQLRGGYRSVKRAMQDLTEAQALEGARADWRRYRWGSGLDGSIAGIVWHVALWKRNFHNLYHAGQIELLRQLRGYPTGAD